MNVLAEVQRENRRVRNGDERHQKVTPASGKVTIVTKRRRKGRQLRPGFSSTFGSAKGQVSTSLLRDSRLKYQWLHGCDWGLWIISKQPHNWNTSCRVSVRQMQGRTVDSEVISEAISDRQLR